MVVPQIEKEKESVSTIPRVVSPRVQVPPTFVVKVTAAVSMRVNTGAMHIPANTVIKVATASRMPMGGREIEPEASVPVVPAAIEVNMPLGVVMP